MQTFYVIYYTEFICLFFEVLDFWKLVLTTTNQVINYISLKKNLYSRLSFAANIDEKVSPNWMMISSAGTVVRDGWSRSLGHTSRM